MRVGLREVSLADVGLLATEQQHRRYSDIAGMRRGKLRHLLTVRGRLAL